MEGDRGGEIFEAVLAELLQLDRAGLEQRNGGGERTTWPPWAALMMRAARWTSRPTYLGGSSAGSPVWIPTLIRIGPPSSPCIASDTALTAAWAVAKA